MVNCWSWIIHGEIYRRVDRTWRVEKFFFCFGRPFVTVVIFSFLQADINLEVEKHKKKISAECLPRIPSDVSKKIEKK